MVQTELFDYLKARRLAGDEGFYTVRALSSLIGLDIQECAFQRAANKLYAFGYLDIVEPWSRYKRAYRLKKKCLRAVKIVSPLVADISSENLHNLE